MEANCQRLLFRDDVSGDEIEIDLYDGTGEYPELQGLPEDVIASEHRPESSSNDGNKLCELYDPPKPLNEAEYDFECLDIPGQSDILHTYTPEELSSWDLLSELSDPYAQIIPSGSSSVPDSPRLDLQLVLVPAPDVPGVERVLAAGSPPSPPGNPCNGKCKGDLLGPHKCQRLQGKLKITCLGNNSCNRVFITKNDFNRHCRTKHELKNIPLIDCEFAGCNRVGNEGFSRKDNMRQHMRDVHRVACPVRQFRVQGPVRGFV